MTDNDLPRTRHHIEQGIHKGWHLGAQLYVSVDFEPVADWALGEAEPGRAMRNDHLLPWLSSGKPLTALAVAQLWETGSLALDDPVGRHIPEFAAHGKGQITLRHLLTHTAGLRRLGLPWPESPWEEIIAWICGLRLESGWIPGEKAGYNRAISWFLLGEIIQRVSGMSYTRYLRERVFQPIGMEDSSMGMQESDYARLSSRIAPIFDTSGEVARVHDFTGSEILTRPSPGRTAIGPIRQLGRFYEVLLADGQFAARYSGQGMSDARKTILRPQTIEAMTARQRVGLEDRTFRSKLDWGLGFIIDSKHYGAEPVPYGYGASASRRTFGHSGYQSSTGFADPAHKLVIALVFNGTPGDGAHENRINAVLEAVYTDLGLGSSPSNS